MNPEKKTTATMNTTPATIPTQAATAGRRDRRGRSSRTGVVALGGASATGSVAGSEEDVVGSLMGTILRAVLMCL
jgi:hypothetical protein